MTSRSIPLLPLLSLQSIESNGHAVVARSDLRRRVGVTGTDECFLQRRRLSSECGHDVVVRGHVGRLRRPPVAGGGVQDVGRARRALPGAPARAALRFGVEEGGGGDVGSLVDVLGEALAGAAGRGGERGAAVAALLQAHVAPCRACHVQFHPCGREGLAALHGASPAVVEGHELGFAAVDGDVL